MLADHHGGNAMRTKIVVFFAVAVLAAASALAQTASANLHGTVIDSSGAVTPGVTVTVRNVGTGYAQTSVTLQTGAYAFSSLPLGHYDVTFELQGFATVTVKGIVLTVGETVIRDATLNPSGGTQTVTVVAAAPLVNTSSATVEGTVVQQQVESLPLNGRQFANLAILVPGISLGTNPDPTHINESAAQVGGSHGRFTNNSVDGGDNNDDVVGGQLQGYSLEAVQEFQIITQQFKAEYGRASQGVVNVVTKSGTNDFKGSGVALFRNQVLNATTESEMLSGTPKEPYSRQQIAGSLGGPILKNRAFFFVAAERLQQDRKELVNTLGLDPSEDGPASLPLRDNSIVAKLTWQASANHSLMFRYGRQTQADVFGASTINPPSSWADSKNSFDSALVNLRSIFGSTRLNELVVQYSTFDNAIIARVTGPSFFYPSGVQTGPNASAPQTNVEGKWQVRDDFAWMATAKGTHNLKAGINFIYEPTGHGTFNTQTAPQYNLLFDRQNSPIQSIYYYIGDGSFNYGTQNILGAYVQDDWEVSSQLTVNLGLRYDYYGGIAYDQSNNATFEFLTTVRPDLNKAFTDPKTNLQPRIGAVWSSTDRKTVVRAGWGRFIDRQVITTFFGHLAASTNPQRLGYYVFAENGITKADGSFLTATDPLPPNQIDPNAFPTPNAFSDPNQVNPRYQHYSGGITHEFSPSTAISVDCVYVVGHDTGSADWINRLPIGGGDRQYAYAGLNFPIREEQTAGRNRYRALNVSIRRHMSQGVQLDAWYSLSSAEATDVRGADEVLVSFPQTEGGINNPVNFGPTLEDATHRVVLSAIFRLPYDIQATTMNRFMSGRPINIRAGTDLNGDGINNDLPVGAAHIDDARGAYFWQTDVRLSKFISVGKGRLEGFVQIFNLFNNKNPLSYQGAATSPYYLQPISYAGDLPSVAGFEQRLGEIGIRVTF
jgi:hypothetical protein